MVKYILSVYKAQATACKERGRGGGEEGKEGEKEGEQGTTALEAKGCKIDEREGREIT